MHAHDAQFCNVALMPGVCALWLQALISSFPVLTLICPNHAPAMLHMVFSKMLQTHSA